MLFLSLKKNLKGMKPYYNYSNEDISDLNKQPETPQENLLEDESDDNKFDLSHLNYLSENKKNMQNFEEEKEQRLVIKDRKMSLEANEALKRYELNYNFETMQSE